MKKAPQFLPLLLLFLTLTTPTSGEEFTLGLLIPFNSSEAPTSAEGSFYAPAIVQAVDDINNNSNLLPGHRVSFIWNDTRCNEDQSLRALSYQIHEKNVSAIIGPGCTCQVQARLASALDIPMISYVSFVTLIISEKKFVHFTRA